MNQNVGTLYIISTPIGNLEDITFRAIKTLKLVDRIACEDTRHTSKLLQHYQIKKPLISFHDHNEDRKTTQLIRSLESGESIALVSDGGTPLVSDPGWRIVQEAIKNNIQVTWIPGPTALIGGLILSGLPTDRFSFEGFLPPKTVARRKRLAALKGKKRTVVFFESPHRLIKMLQDVREELGNTEVAVARELTKVYEEVRRGQAEEVIEHFKDNKPRGEFVVIVNIDK